MASYRLAVLLVVALAASAIAAPLDETAGQSGKDAATTVASATTTVAASSTTAEPAASSTAATLVESSSTPAQQTAPTPSTDSSSTGATGTTESLTASPAHDLGHNISISFTCYGRNLGYYADVETKCKVYHFCLLGEYNGDPIYQRVSYMCVHDKVFDQQALDCVMESELKAPCKDSTTYYDISNKVLRQAVLSGHSVSDTDLTKANSTESHKASGSAEATA